MTLLDMTIIYLALGSPFAVHYLTRGDHPNWRTLLAVPARLLFWPAFAVFTAMAAVDRRGTLVHGDRQIAPIIAELESRMFGSGETPGIFDFRETIHRYAGLAVEANREPGPPSTPEIFSAAGNGCSAASVCLARKHRRQLSFHLDRARDEFVDQVAMSIVASKHPETIIGLACKTAEIVDDPTCVALLRALSGPVATIKSAAEIFERGEIWNSNPANQTMVT